MREQQKTVGPFRITGCLGEGGMGVVYRAMNPADGREVALKTVRVPDAWMLQSIRREVHGLARLRHPGIVRILDHGIDQGIPWYAMEIVPGESLAHLLVAGLLGDLRDRLTLVRRLCAPLAFLHGEGVVHLDLKPANVIVRPDGMPVLMDFGLLTRFPGATHREVLDASGPSAGTASYMAPEQFRGELVDARTDLYALGCILFEMLSGAPPFMGDSLTQVMDCHLARDPPCLSDVLPDAPSPLVDLVRWLLAKDPRERVGHADFVASVLARLGAEDGLAASGPRPRSYLYRPSLGGRARQLADLRRHMAVLSEGRGGIVLMGGESGVGKTRLAIEIGRESVMDGALLLAGECLATGARPLEPLRAPLQAIADHCRQMGESVAAEVLGVRGPVLAAYEPSLATVPGQGRFPDPPEVPAEAARFRLLLSLTEVFAAMAGRRKTLLILDDLQWADELTLQWLSFLAQGTHLGSCPLVVLGTYRAEEASARLRALVDGPGVTSVALDRLDEDAVGTMVGDMLALHPPNEELGRRIAGLSGGNPFFVAEYLRAAVSEGLLSRDGDGRWRIAVDDGTLGLEAALAALPMPASLQELSDRRLARLSGGARRAAAAASAAGREVPEALFAALCGAGEVASLELASELIRAEVLEEGEAGTLRFVHDKVREAAYRSLSTEDRRTVHREVAAWYERTHAGDLSPFHTVLAHHWQEAGDAPRAVFHLGEAGGQALRRGAYEEALAHTRRALDLSEALAPARDGARDPVRRARWERQAAEAALGLGRLAESRERMERAAAMLGWPVPSSLVALCLGVLAEVLMQVWHWFRPPRPLDPAAPEAARLLEGARVFRGLLSLYYFRSELPATLHAGLRSLNLAQRLGASAELVDAYANVAFAAALAPMPALAGAYGQRAIVTARQARATAALAWAMEVDGVWRAGAGDWDRAIKSLVEAAAICDDLRDPRHWIEATCAHSTILHYRGEWAPRLDMGRAVHERARLSGNLQGQAWGMLDQAESLLPLGRIEEALSLLEGAKILLAADIGRAEEVWTYGLIARAGVLDGRSDLAVRAADEALCRMERVQPTAFYTLDGYAGTTEAFLSAWEAEAGSGAAGDALRSRAARACACLRKFAKVMPIGRPWAWLHQGTFHWIDGRRARAHRAWARALDAAAHLGMPLAEGLAHLESGRHLPPGSAERRAHIEAARATFERLGAVRHLQAARAATEG